ncbi:hypothetical protein LPJ53_005110 [Coemansia erecta]|uniref:Uncharacterized protein n=1 Tax=Coemansia erecta TaxID=147472 RepID=A0A9W8CP44_9FUNG|nr:hypothetical protein LPJ53_005110 [Coemansia erecta]
MVRVTSEQQSSLHAAASILDCQFICLSRLREPLGLVGGYWGMDADIITRVTAGTPGAAIKGITRMCDFFDQLRGTPGLPETVSRDICLFVERAGIWVQVNRIC